ncbi:MAG: hypothetical protein WB791_11430 [Waddliaceae bacterium]
MRKQIAHVSVHQTSKVLAILHLLFSAIIFIPVGLITYFSTGMPEGLVLLIYPVIFAVLAYIMFAINSLFYNWIASYFGGVEVSVNEVEKQYEAKPPQGL